MDYSTSAAPHQPSQRALTHRLAMAVVLLFVTGVIAVSVALLSIVSDLDDDDVRDTRFYSERALANRIIASKNYITSYANWTAAFENLSGKVDVDWAFDEQNLGKTLYTTDGYDGVFVLDQERTKYAVVKGQLVQSDISDYLPLSSSNVIAQVQAQADITRPISVYSLFEGWPALITASAILPTDERKLDNHHAVSVLVFVDKLTSAKLRELGRAYGLSNLSLIPDGVVIDSPQRVSLDNTGFSLVAGLDRPGYYLLWSLLPTLIGTFVVLVMLMGYFFRHALRSSKYADTSFDSIQRSNKALEEANQALESSQERFRAVAEAISDWIWEVDTTHSITYLSGRFGTVTGFSDFDWLGQEIGKLLQCDTTPLSMWFGDLVEASARNDLRCSYRDKSGQIRHCRVSAHPILDKGCLIGYRGTVTDITDEVAAHAQIQHLSMHDALTGLPNRNKLSRFLDEILHCNEQSTALSVLMIDLDNFKPINDSLGHPVGDVVLQEVGKRLRDSTRESDLVARLGGDEFVVVLSGIETPAEIDKFCARLINILRQPVEYDGHTMQVGASIGVAVGRERDCIASELIRCADIALYQAKADGKNTWCYFEPHMSEQIEQRRQMEDELRNAIRNKEFLLHYQPRYKVDGKDIVSVEALVRWQHPSRGLLGPDLFIPLAEQTDLIVPLGRWVLREACETALAWPDVILSVNLSPIQFAHSDVVEDVREVLVTTQYPGSRLELEITENVMLNDTAGALVTMNALKQLGVRLNMDDFGTGYSSLGYLRIYPFDGIKIDKRFIASIGNGASDRAVVRAIISLGKAMGLTVTAEGVETEEQLNILGCDECHEVQGYLMSKPVEAKSLARLLEVSRSKVLL